MATPKRSRFTGFCRFPYDHRPSVPARQPLTPPAQLLSAVLPRPQQSPPPRSQGVDLTRRRRREPANQPPRITTVCGGRVACSAMWHAGKWRQTQLELGCACLPAPEGSTRCCCPAFCTRLYECLPLHFLTTLLLRVRRTSEHGSIFYKTAPRRLYGGLQDYDARAVQVACAGAAQ